MTRLLASSALLGLPLLGYLLHKMDQYVTTSIDRHVAAALDEPARPDEFDMWADQAIDLTRDIPGQRLAGERWVNPSRR